MSTSRRRTQSPRATPRAGACRSRFRESPTPRAKNLNAVNAPYRAAFARIDGPIENISLRSVGDDIAVLRVRGFSGERFPAQLDSVVVAAVDAGTRAMILDLRGNGGGVDDFGALLVSKFRSSPFRYFDHIHLTTIKPSFATWKPSTFDSTCDGTVPAASGRGTIPDHVVPRTTSDILRGVDAGIAKAIEILTAANPASR